MKVSGFSFIRNGTLLGLPYLASIQSLLLLCDEVIVAVGKSDDDTLARVQSLNSPKLRIIETTWNEHMHDRGFVYGQQKMIAQFNCNGDWAVYLEGDEIIDERDIPLIRAQMAKYLANKKVEALVFDYYHFYGTPWQIAYSPRWYRKAPRIIRNNIRTIAPDGLFWVVLNKNKKARYPYAVPTGCYIYHYGHVRLASTMHEKQQRVERYWGKNPQPFLHYGDIDKRTLKPFKGQHPANIANWLKHFAESSFVLNQNYQLTKRDKRHRWLMFLSKLFGDYDFSKKHYRLLKQ